MAGIGRRLAFAFPWLIALPMAGVLAGAARAQSGEDELEVLRSGEAAERVAALAALARIESTAPILEAVALALGDREHEVRRAAVETLLAQRKDLEPLRARLTAIVAVREVGQQQVGRWNVAVGLGGFGAAPDLQQHVDDLGSEDAEVRRRAVVALCALGTAAAAHEGDLLHLLADPDAEVRAAVAKNIGSIGWTDGIRTAELGALKDAAAVVRHAAAEALTAHSDDVEVVAALRGAVQDPDVDVRAEVLRGLGRSGKAGVSAEGDIVASLRDREPEVRVAALEAVRDRKLTSERAVRDAIRCLDERDHKVLLAALPALAAMEQAAGSALPRILELTGHDRSEVRLAALVAAWAVAEPNRRGAVVLRSVEMLRDVGRGIEGRVTGMLIGFVDAPR